MKNRSLLPQLAIPLQRALAGGESTATGAVVHVLPLSVERQYQSALPPVPCWAKARISVAAALYETAQPPSWNMLFTALPKVVHVDHCAATLGSVMRWY